jgi:hypothetical protein
VGNAGCASDAAGAGDIYDLNGLVPGTVLNDQGYTCLESGDHVLSATIVWVEIVNEVGCII